MDWMTMSLEARNLAFNNVALVNGIGCSPSGEPVVSDGPGRAHSALHSASYGRPYGEGGPSLLEIRPARLTSIVNQKEH